MLGHVPPRPFLDTILLRTLLLWTGLPVIVRVTPSAAAVLTGEADGASLVASLLVFAVVVAALRVEMGRRSELVFMANLGHSSRDVAVLAAATCAAFDLSVRLLLG